jgi:hypothetical protein
MKSEEDESNRPEIVDMGFSRCLMPGEKRLVRLQPQRRVKVERMFVEQCFGVSLLGVTVGHSPAGSAGDFPVSTLFYSVPTNPTAVAKIGRMIRALEGREVDYPDILEFVELESDPGAALGLPVSWPTVNIGNSISLEFENKSHDPVRITVVLRGRAI